MTYLRLEKEESVAESRGTKPRAAWKPWWTPRASVPVVYWHFSKDCLAKELRFECSEPEEGPASHGNRKRSMTARRAERKGTCKSCNVPFSPKRGAWLWSALSWPVQRLCWLHRLLPRAVSFHLTPLFHGKHKCRDPASLWWHQLGHIALCAESSAVIFFLNRQSRYGLSGLWGMVKPLTSVFSHFSVTGWNCPSGWICLEALIN